MRHALDLWRGQFPRTMFDMVNDFDTLFGRNMGDQNVTTTEEKVFRPSTDVSETEKAYLLSFDLPGVKQEDIKIDLLGNTLKVTGVRRTESDVRNERVHRVERYYGKFERSFELPDMANLDGVEANYENGVLHVIVPKAEASKPRAVEVQAGKGQNFFSKFLGTKEEVKKEDSKH